VCTLELRGSKDQGWRLESCEHQILAKLSADFDLSFKSRTKKKVTPGEGSILRWQIHGVDLSSQTVNLKKYCGLAHKKTKADLYSKIAFQFQARTGSCVSFESLLKATESEFIEKLSGMNDLLMTL